MVSPVPLSDYRPISCCNAIYMIISKILSFQLRKILGHLIHSNQSALIPGRRITYNILLAHELVRDYHKNKGDCCAFKVDFQKVYDYVSWDFIEEVLLAYRFPTYFFKLIMNGVRTCKISIMINGKLERFFLGKKGIRQATMYPLFYLFYAWIILLVLNKMTSNSFSFHKQCKES